MEIKKTFIVYHEQFNAFVKVHECQNSKYEKKYFIEFQDGKLAQITAANFIELID